MNEKQYDPMSQLEVFEKVREGCERYMYLIDEEGQCAESDEYVVALAFFEDYIEKIIEEEEKEAVAWADWGQDEKKP